MISEIFEIGMLICFGLSWPFNVAKAYRARTAKGKSLPFLLFIESGYVFGIAGKLLSGSFAWYVLFFYILNFTMVATDIALYFRNRHLDRVASLK